LLSKAVEQVLGFSYRHTGEYSRIVSTVDISAGPESTQTAQAVEYVVAVPATRHDLERMRSRVRLGGDDGGRSPTLSGRNHAPHTGVGGSFEVGANGAF
jgi:hypothetical protein